MTTIDNIMVIADSYAAVSAVSTTAHAIEVRAALVIALTEALAQQSQTTGCTSNCDNCTYAHGSPAHAGYCYMFYDEPQGVCAQWKDANPTIRNYPEKDISAQPVREPLNKSEWPKHPSAYVNDEYIGYSKSDLTSYAMQVLQAHGIGGDK